jgi:hypothetical protein
MLRESAILAVIVLAGCATNETQVRDRASVDLRCDAAQVSVQLLERPYLGVTRYEAEGCGATREYECRARAYSAGLPIGERACRREGSAPSGVVELPGRAGF